MRNDDRNGTRNLGVCEPINHSSFLSFDLWLYTFSSHKIYMHIKFSKKTLHTYASIFQSLNFLFIIQDYLQIILVARDLFCHIKRIETYIATTNHTQHYLKIKCVSLLIELYNIQKDSNLILRDHHMLPTKSL